MRPISTSSSAISANMFLSAHAAPMGAASLAEGAYSRMRGSSSCPPAHAGDEQPRGTWQMPASAPPPASCLSVRLVLRKTSVHCKDNPHWVSFYIHHPEVSITHLGRSSPSQEIHLQQYLVLSRTSIKQRRAGPTVASRKGIRARVAALRGSSSIAEARAPALGNTTTT